MHLKSIFDKPTNEEIKSRIDKLSNDNKIEWGKMGVALMLHHCYIGLQMASGVVVLKRNIVELLIGPIIMRKSLKRKLFHSNSPTAKELLVQDNRIIDIEKKRLKERLQQYYVTIETGASKAPHAFFGNMSPCDWGQTQYIHLDHHLRQFFN